MPTPTYDLIASNVLTTSPSSVSFTSLNTIAAGYRDLILVIRATNSGAAASLRFNGDTGLNYSIVRMQGAATASSSAGSDDQISISYNFPAIIQIFDFSQTDKHKTVLTRENQDSIVMAKAARWANTAAITSIDLQNLSGFASGTTLYLYGIVS